MRSLVRSLILVSPLFWTLALITTPLAQASALALPVSFPMPFINADYDNHLARIPHATRRSAVKGSHLHNSAKPPKAASSKHGLSGNKNSSSTKYRPVSATNYEMPRVFRRANDGMDALLGELSTSSDAAKADSQDLQGMAMQSASQGNDPNFQQNAATKLSSFQQNAQGLGGILGQLAADKGLANYDKNDKLETSLKDFINANKDALSAVNTMVQNDPALGPILGPIVYEIKCIIDDILDITENLTDGLLNTLKPLLAGVSGKAGDMTCSSNLKLWGFCLK